MAKPRWIPFRMARIFAHSLELKSEDEWKNWVLRHKPEDLPICPEIVYKHQGWRGWQNWLGRKRKKRTLKNYRPFLEAREYVHSLKFKSQIEWYHWCKTEQKPHDIPTACAYIYKNKGWDSWEDWLGHDRKKKEFLPFKEAREIVHTFHLESQIEWNHCSKIGKRPPNIPSHPHQIYQKQGWLGWADWLGIKKNPNEKKNPFLPFEEARHFVRNLHLKDNEEWQNWRRSPERPDNIPKVPDLIYRKEGWSNWADWLGIESTPGRGQRTYRPFLEAKTFAHSLHLNSIKEWNQWSKTGLRPKDVPSNPSCIYQEWVDWQDWLGTEKGRGARRIYRPFLEARTFAHSLHLNNIKEWFQWCKLGQRPRDIPSNPSRIYREKGWIDWPDWFGKSPK